MVSHISFDCEKQIAITNSNSSLTNYGFRNKIVLSIWISYLSIQLLPQKQKN